MFNKRNLKIIVCVIAAFILGMHYGGSDNSNQQIVDKAKDVMVMNLSDGEVYGFEDKSEINNFINNNLEKDKAYMLIFRIGEKK